MRRVSTLVAALGAVFAMGSAQAQFFLVDDFNGPDMFVADLTTAAGGGLTIGPVGPTNGLNMPALSRTVTHELLVGPNAASGIFVAGSFSNVIIGSTSFPTGSLNISNATGRDSEVTIAWTLPPNFLAGVGPANFRFDVISSDANQTTAQLFFGATSLGNFPIAGNSANAAQLFSFDDVIRQQINAGGNLRLVLNGEDGWDMSLDSFGFQIPEPTTLALVGLALLGAGVASRRRKG